MQQIRLYPQHPVPVLQVNHTPRMDQALKVRTTKCLSIILIVAGLLLFGLQLVCTVIYWHRLGTGIWCGMFIIISGIIGVQAASKKTNALAVAFLIFNILCVIVFAPVVIAIMAISISFSHYYSALNTVLTIFMLLDGILVFFLSIWGIVTNSMAIEKAKACGCCCSDDTTSQMQTPIVVYLPANQVPLAPSGQPSRAYVLSNAGGLVDPIQEPINAVVYNGNPSSFYAAGVNAPVYSSGTTSKVYPSGTAATVNHGGATSSVNHTGGISCDYPNQTNAATRVSDRTGSDPPTYEP